MARGAPSLVISNADNLALLQGNAVEVLRTLASGSVRCCVTSPPYWALRRYMDEGAEGADVEHGLEQTPAGTAPGDVVLDPFYGSGTVGVVALRHGRCFVGIDLNEKNLAIAQERIDTAPALELGAA